MRYTIWMPHRSARKEYHVLHGMSVDTQLRPPQLARARKYAEEFCKRLHLYTETPDEIIADTVRGKTTTVDLYTTPKCKCRRGSGCQHAFPKFFIEDAGIGRSLAALRHYAEIA